jgi:thioredoxin 1
MKTLLKFWAPWCAPCVKMAPIINNVLKEFDNIKLVEVNVEENSSLSAQYKVRSIPMLILIDNETNSTKEIVGSRSAEELKKFLSSNV